MKFLLVSFTVVTFLAGCSSVSRLPADLSTQSKLYLAFRIDSIMYVDLRPDTSSDKMDLPPFAGKQREWKISPTLTPSLKAELSSMIKSSSNPEGLPTVVTVTLDEGYYMVSGNAGQVGEHTLFNCSMLFDVKGATTDFKTFARANYDYVGVFNATEKEAKELYRITARNGIYTALKNAEKVFD